MVKRVGIGGGWVMSHGTQSYGECVEPMGIDAQARGKNFSTGIKVKNQVL